MKNSPHKYKHLMKKALREASQMEVKPIIQKIQIFTKSFPIDLIPFNVNRARNKIELYKKHLERERLFRSVHESRHTTPGQVEKGPFNIKQKNPNKINDRWNISGLEKTKQFSRKMIKHQNYKKAA